MPTERLAVNSLEKTGPVCAPSSDFSALQAPGPIALPPDGAVSPDKADDF